MLKLISNPMFAFSCDDRSVVPLLVESLLLLLVWRLVEFDSELPVPNECDDPLELESRVLIDVPVDSPVLLELELPLELESRVLVDVPVD